MEDLYRLICQHISEKWLGPSEDSARKFAIDHDIDEKTVRRIRSWKKTPYKITLYTLEKLCLSKGLSLEEFFKEIQR